MKELHYLPCLAFLTAFFCPHAISQPNQAMIPMDTIAQYYVRLVLGVGQHDPNYVDAYYGPPAWQDEAAAHKISLDEIHLQAESLLAELNTIGTTSRMDEMLYLRHQYLIHQLQALIARTEMLQGKKFTFDEESQALYDAVAPVYPESHFQALLAELDAVLPHYKSAESIQQRYEEFRSSFVIPPDKLDAVFTAAIQECRKRSRQHITLPDHESFTVEYVTQKPWGAYNWYKGNSRSVIQVNTDLPIYIDRAIDLAGHEGYPGHHVYNALLEETLVRKKGWVEFTVYPLFSPQSLIAEGSANFGVEVLFSHSERIAFERDVLFPLAGMDGSKAALYRKVADLAGRLAYADNEAARSYLNGEMDREAAIVWLMKYRLMGRERAEQRVKFIETYRSYVINYNLGQDLVKKYVESHGGVPGNPTKRWEEFAKLLSSPRLPSGLK